MNQVLGLINLSLVPLRGEPAHSSEMLSQLMFGDCFEVIATEGYWAYIKTFYDGYEGWLDQKQFLEIDELTKDQFVQSKWLLDLSPQHLVKNLNANQIMYLVPGSTIPKLTNGQFKIRDLVYQLAESQVRQASQANGAAIVEAAQFYLTAPYLWGGKSLYGIDCSGFTQMVFKQYGLSIKRDAYQQGEQGILVNFLEEARAGDLAFFDNEAGRITHVGIMMNNRQIIHASGRVKIDSIDSQGIFNEDLQRYTHKLRIIKRFLS